MAKGNRTIGVNRKGGFPSKYSGATPQERNKQAQAAYRLKIGLLEYNLKQKQWRERRKLEKERAVLNG